MTVDIPDNIAEHITSSGRSFQRAVLEALACEGYRTLKLTEFQVQQLLGLETRMQVHGFLKDHHTYLNYSIEDFNHDMETIRRVTAAEEEKALAQAG